MQSNQMDKHCVKFLQEENCISHAWKQLSYNLENKELKIYTQEIHSNTYYLS